MSWCTWEGERGREGRRQGGKRACFRLCSEGERETDRHTHWQAVSSRGQSKRQRERRGAFPLLETKTVAKRTVFIARARGSVGGGVTVMSLNE